MSDEPNIEAPAHETPAEAAPSQVEVEEAVSESAQAASVPAPADSSAYNLRSKLLLVLSVIYGLLTGLLGLVVVILAGSGLHNAVASGALVLLMLAYGLGGYLVGIQDSFEKSQAFASDYSAAAAFGHLGFILSIVMMVPGEFKHGALFGMAFVPFGLVYAGAWFGDQMRASDTAQDGEEGTG